MQFHFKEVKNFNDGHHRIEHVKAAYNAMMAQFPATNYFTAEDLAERSAAVCEFIKLLEKHGFNHDAKHFRKNFSWKTI
jgi:hypothetical protein